MAFSLEIKTAADRLEEARGRALSRLASYRWQVQSGGVEVEGAVWHSDHEGRQSIHEALTLAQLYEAEHGSWSITWKAQSGFTTATVPLLVQVGQTIGAHVAGCFAREAALADDIAGSSDPDAVDITTGWPGQD